MKIKVQFCIMLFVLYINIPIVMANPVENLNISLKRIISKSFVTVTLKLDSLTENTPVSVKITGPDGSNEINYVEQGFTDSNGSFSFVYKNIGAPGTYIIKGVLPNTNQSFNKEYMLFDQTKINSIFTNITTQVNSNTPNLSQVRQEILDNSEGLGLDLNIYSRISNSDDVFNKFIALGKKKTFSNIEEIIELFYSSVILCATTGEQASVNFTNMLNNEIYSDILALDQDLPSPTGAYHNYLEMLTSRMREKIFSVTLKTSYNDISQLVDALCLNTLTQSLYYAEHWSEVIPLLKAYISFGKLSISFGEYNKLVDKESIDALMMHQNFNSYNDVKVYFDSAVASQYAKEHPPANPIGGIGKPISVPISKPTAQVAIKNETVQDISPQKGKFKFADMDDAKWAVYAVERLAELGIVSGSNNLFRPNDNINRAELIKLVIASLNEEPTMNECIFIDVNKSDWYYSYAVKASEIMLIKGDGQGRFNGENIVNREEAAVIITRMIGNMGVKLKNDSLQGRFTDTEVISTWAREAVDTLHQNGIIKGNTNNTFTPQGLLTRAEAAKLLYEALVVAGKI